MWTTGSLLHDHVLGIIRVEPHCPTIFCSNGWRQNLSVGQFSFSEIARLSQKFCVFGNDGERDLCLAIRREDLGFAMP